MENLKILYSDDIEELLNLLNKINSQSGSTSNYEEEQISMLLEIKGTSIGKIPRKDGRLQAKVRTTDDGNLQYFYGRNKEELIIKIQKYLRGEKPKRKKKTSNIRIG